MTIEGLKAEIDRTMERGRFCREKRIAHAAALETLLENLHNLHICINPLAIPANDAVTTIHLINEEVQMLMKKVNRNIDREILQEKVRK